MIMLPDSLGILVYLLSYVGPELLPVVVDRRELGTSKTVGRIFALDVDGESADAFDGGFDDFARLQKRCSPRTAVPAPTGRRCRC